MTETREPADPGPSAETDDEYVRRYFAADAVTYDQRERWRRRMRTLLLDLAAVQPGEAVLDVCTGTGAVAFALAERGAQVTGIDLSLDMLQRAQGRADQRVRFLAGDASHLPFPDGAFAVSTLSMALHCMPAELRPRVLAEMARVSRRRVALMEPNTPAGTAGRWLLANLGRWQHSPKYWPDFVSHDLTMLVSGAGLELERRQVFNLGIHQVVACRPRH